VVVVVLVVAVVGARGRGAVVGACGVARGVRMVVCGVRRWWLWLCELWLCWWSCWWWSVANFTENASAACRREGMSGVCR
jgi:hypothetical protein